MDLFIRDILRRGLDDQMIEKILSLSFDKLQAAFTTREYDNDKNYEFFEQLGDLSINKFIVSYMGKRFPQLKSSAGVGVLASLRMSYGSKDVLSKFCEKYGMDKYIRCTQEEMIDRNKFRDILEDVFEAFFGALEYSIDEIWYYGLGYIIVYNILKTMFDELEIKIDYESLVDAKTRLNELKDGHKKLILKYIDVRRISDGYYHTKLFINNNTLIGEGVSPIKKQAQILAAEQGLDWIEKNMNIKKEIPERYKTIAKKLW